VVTAAASRSRTELDLPLALVDNAGRVLSRDQLMTLARGFEADVAERTVDASSHRLHRAEAASGKRT
jgi:DNA-binding response OmpR family regulator